MVIIVICLLTENKSISYKSIIKMSIFQFSFENFDTVESVEKSFKWNLYDFSFICIAIDKSNIVNFHKYLMVKNNIKLCFGLLNKCLLYYLVLVNV